MKRIALAAALLITGGTTFAAYHHIPKLVPHNSLASLPQQTHAGAAASTLPHGQSARISAVDFISPSDGWVVGTIVAKNGPWLSETLYHTINGGKSWTTLATWNKTHPMPSPTQAVTGLAAIDQLSFQNARLGHALLFLGAGAGSAGYGVLSTTDGGAQWTLETPKPLLGSDGPVGLDFPSDGSTGWLANGSSAGAYTQVADTTDNGASWSTWSHVPTPDPSPAALSMHFSSPTSGFIVVGTNGYQKTHPSLRLLTTTTGGRRWQSHVLSVQGLPDWIAGVSFLNAQTGWVVGGSANHPYQLYHRSHGDWKALPTPDASANNSPTLDLVTTHVAYVAQQNGPHTTLWKTVNGSKGWSKVAFPLN